MPDQPDTRTTLSPRVGTKISLLVAIPFIAAGLYFLTTPITTVRTTTGAVFGCGSALNPPTPDVEQSICTGLATQYQYRAAAGIGSGVLIAVVGSAMFGADRKVEHAQNGSSRPSAR